MRALCIFVHNLSRFSTLRNDPLTTEQNKKPNTNVGFEMWKCCTSTWSKEVTQIKRESKTKNNSAKSCFALSCC